MSILDRQVGECDSAMAVRDDFVEDANGIVTVKGL